MLMISNSVVHRLLLLEQLPFVKLRAILEDQFYVNKYYLPSSGIDDCRSFSLFVLKTNHLA